VADVLRVVHSHRLFAVSTVLIACGSDDGCAPPGAVPHASVGVRALHIGDLVRTAGRGGTRATGSAGGASVWCDRWCTPWPSWSTRRPPARCPRRRDRMSVAFLVGTCRQASEYCPPRIPTRMVLARRVIGERALGSSLSFAPRHPARRASPYPDPLDPYGRCCRRRLASVIVNSFGCSASTGDCQYLGGRTAPCNCSRGRDDH
jgi:hypothetical protein